MGAPFWQPNLADCPECGGTANDIDHPENWFTCQCGHGFAEFATKSVSRKEFEEMYPGPSEHHEKNCVRRYYMSQSEERVKDSES